MPRAIEHNPLDFDPRAVTTQRGPLAEDARDNVVRPSRIDASRHLFNAYGNMETEISAAWIIRMCQQSDSWDPFTLADIERFYQEGGFHDGFRFNQLVSPGTGEAGPGVFYPVGGGWIVEKDGEYHVTAAFVEAAYKASPAPLPLVKVVGL